MAKSEEGKIVIGGLDRGAKEEDIREVFGKVGEITEVCMMMDGQTEKSRGFCFLSYKEAAQSKKSVAEFAKVEGSFFAVIYFADLGTWSVLSLLWFVLDLESGFSFGPPALQTILDLK